jgi:hypothetical protein
LDALSGLNTEIDDIDFEAGPENPDVAPGAAVGLGQVEKAVILCSDYFKNADRSVYLYTEKEIARRGGSVTSARNHSKIILARTDAGSFAVESSANLRSCNNLEQFALTNSRGLYDFHARWIKGLLK